METLGDMGHGVEYATCARILHETALAGYDAMRACGVEPASHMSTLARCEGRGGLEPVGDGFLHAADMLYDGTILLGSLAEKLLNVGLLAFELDGVGDGEQLTAAAGLSDRARVRAVSHGAPFISH